VLREELEHWIKENAGGDNREGVRADAVAVAIDHVRQAVDALELASRDGCGIRARPSVSMCTC